jgi:hypothetical protein
MNLTKIENKTKKYADVYSDISRHVTIMRNEVEAAENRCLPNIKTLLVKLKAAGEDLRLEINDNKHLFVKPKTIILHNFRIGIMKGKGKKEFNNANTIKLIRKWFPPVEQKQLIETKEKVVSSALDTLPAPDLKKIGVEIKDAHDEIIIRPVDSEIKKVIDKIIAEIKYDEEID